MVVKKPVPGMVKMRLTPYLRPEESARLYRAFMEDIISSLSKRRFQLIVSFFPPGDSGWIRKIVGESTILYPQVGKDLGQRLYNAFLRAFEDGYERVVAVCSDCPDLPPRLIHEAFISLKEYKSVLGPSHDGGYYLIGFRRGELVRSTLENVAMSRPDTAERTINCLEKEGHHPKILESWMDVDEPDDLKRFKKRYSLERGPPHTMDVVENIFEKRDDGNRAE